jgi:hypothetical protein
MNTNRPFISMPELTSEIWQLWLLYIICTTTVLFTIVLLTVEYCAYFAANMEIYYPRRDHARETALDPQHIRRLESGEVTPNTRLAEVPFAWGGASIGPVEDGSIAQRRRASPTKEERSGYI